MKKSIVYLMMMVLSLSIFSSIATASEKKTVDVAANSKEMPAKVKVMFTRLEEIKAMDKSSLNSSEKKALRKEVRTIKAALKSADHGVYFSIAALLLIILILILIL